MEDSKERILVERKEIRFKLGLKINFSFHILLSPLAIVPKNVNEINGELILASPLPEDANH